MHLANIESALGALTVPVSDPTAFSSSLNRGPSCRDVKRGDIALRTWGFSKMSKRMGGMGHRGQDCGGRMLDRWKY